jgi:hypothetical protein
MKNGLSCCPGRTRLRLSRHILPRLEWSSAAGASVSPLSCFGENSENRSADGGVEACLNSQWKREVSHTVMRGSCKVVVRLLPGMIRDPDVYYYLCAFIFAAKVEPRSVPWCQLKGIDMHEGGRTCNDG